KNGDVVARPNATIPAFVAQKRPPLMFGDELDGFDFGTESVVAGEVADGEVMRVNVIAGGDRLGGEADDLPVATHRCAFGNGSERDFVPAGDELVHRNVNS